MHGYIPYQERRGWAKEVVVVAGEGDGGVGEGGKQGYGYDGHAAGVFAGVAEVGGQEDEEEGGDVGGRGEKLGG